MFVGRKTQNRILSGILSVVLLLACLVCMGTRKAEAASGGAITDIFLMKGSNAPAELEEKGYSALMRPLCGSGDDSVYLGYKRGSSSPITGMLLSSGSSDNLSHAGRNYTLVSKIRVLGGSAAYLYITRDPGDGELMAVTLNSDSGFEDMQLLALQNDGTVPVRFDTGTVADFGSGDRTYLFLTYSNICKPYISEVLPVTGSNKRDAVLRAAAQCDYYYDGGFIDSKGACLVIGYNRTANLSEALRCLTAYPANTGNTENGTLTIPEAAFRLTADIAFGGEQEFWLYGTKDPAAGNPIMELTSSAIPVRSMDVSGKLVEFLFLKSASSIAANLVKNEALYQQLSVERKQLTHVPVVLPEGEALITTPLAFTCLAEGLPELCFEEAVQPEDGTDTEETEDTGDTESTESTESTEGKEDRESETTETTEASEEPGEKEEQPPQEEPGDEPPEIVDDFDPDTYLEEQAEVIADEKAPDEAASMIGEGKLSSLFIILGFIFLGVGGGVLANKLNKRKEDAKNDDDEKN